MGAIRKLTIEGFKSIRKLEDLELGAVNVLIGANGAGKSNFVGFFRFLRDLVSQRLQLALAKDGGADACLFLGPKVSKRVAARIDFQRESYEFALEPGAGNRLLFSREERHFQAGRWEFGSGHDESRLVDSGGYDLFREISDHSAYHFHDTSATAGVRRQGEVNDNESLRPDAENLAAVLNRIRSADPPAYQRIRSVVRLAAPFFDDFTLRPVLDKPHLIELEWRQRGSDYPFRPHQLSDGTVRFICLATALLQPSPPASMVFDEPEIGLHPFALTLLGNLFHQAASGSGEAVQRQVIVSTQSAQLLNEFDPSDVIVVERSGDESRFRRLASEPLSEWLEEYSLGELWQKNIIGGRPAQQERSA